jgi:hypothetical protein
MINFLLRQIAPSKGGVNARNRRKRCAAAVSFMIKDSHHHQKNESSLILNEAANDVGYSVQVDIKIGHITELGPTQT